MSYQRLFRSLLLLGAPGSIVLAIGCAGILGIEDAECDPSFDAECALPGAGGGSAFGTPPTTSNLLPANGGGGGAPGVTNVAAGGAGGSAPAVAQGNGGQGGGNSNINVFQGSAGAPMGAMAGAAGNSSAGGGDPVVERASAQCLDYCQTVTTACTGTSQQYASQTACLLVCEQLQPGAPGATTGNNVACRASRAALAASTGEAANYCYTAGPGGGDVCGSDCEGYCTVMMAKCSQFSSLNQCLTDCRATPDLSLPPNPQFYNTSMQSGDSVQCRLFHVTASTLDPVTHCIHAAGNMPCL